MTPLQRYQQDLDSGEFTIDQSQSDAIELTQALYQALVSVEAEPANVFSRLISRFTVGQTETIKGLYFWGGVGRGKTWIVDAFYDCLPFEQKMRMHFHRFMRMVHHDLKALEDIQDPLKVVAKNIAEKVQVICFDEFHVSDITDAMLLGGLLQALFEQGVVLVTTSNEHPDSLYWDGLQRERFLPAIELLKQYTRVINVDAGTDYRLRYLDKAEIYHQPLDERAQQMLLENFQHIAPDTGSEKISIEIEDRQIETVRCADGVVWFDFYAICDGPRGPADYIEIGRLFQTVLISDVPQMDENQNDLTKRFMTLVDEFYDRNVKLILTATTTPDHLYQGKRLSKPFKRTISRLIEMQTHDYLARQHLCD
jgi:cell division protein ZapE